MSLNQYLLYVIDIYCDKYRFYDVA